MKAYLKSTQHSEYSIPKRVLIYRLGSLGDMLIALPALRLIERAFPSAERRMLTSVPPNAKAAPAAQVLDKTHLIHGFFDYPYGTRNPFKLLRLLWQIRSWKPDIAVYLNGERTLRAAHRDAQFLRLCGIRRQIGVPVTEEMRAHERRPTSAGLEMFEPEAERLTRNLAQLGPAHTERKENWSIQLDAAELAQAAVALQSLQNAPFIAVSMGTKLQANDWGLENWSALLAQLAERYPEHGLAITGAATEATAADSVLAAWRAHSALQAINFCGALSIRQSAAVYAHSSVFIGHDSGPMHLAAAAGTPCVAIFGARNPPGIWFPQGDEHRVLYHRVDCMGCGLAVCILEQKKCILSISVGEVLFALEGAMRAQPL
jgi:ADP-heptose:LPS heptosyltransferase